MDGRMDGREILERVLNEQGAESLESLDPITREDVHDRRSDRTLKRWYAGGLFLLLVLQLAVMNFIFWEVGSKSMAFQPWTLEIYMTGTMAEIFLVVRTVTKHLFPHQ